MSEAGRLAELGIFKAAKAFFKTTEKRGTTTLSRKLRQDILKCGAPGREALDTLDKHGVEVVTKKGGGSFYESGANRITLDGQRADTVVHEATHVRWTREGRSADIASMDRTTYINKTLDEETDASVNQIRANIELQKTGANVPDAPMQDHYLHGYNNARQRADAAGRAQHRPLTYAELDQAGEAGGRGAVNAAYHSGQIRTSNTNTPYPDYYGNAWDQYQAWAKQWGQHP